MALAVNAKIGLAARATRRAAAELLDFFAVAVATVAVLGFLTTALFGPSAPPGAPQSVETVPRAMSYLMLVYVTPQTVVSYDAELLQGTPSAGAAARGALPPWEALSPLWLATTVVAKFVLPAITAWSLKKASLVGD